jgi:hypothetical protein
MISLQEFKNTLNDNGLTTLTDEEVVKLRDHQDQMAELFFCMWVDKIKKTKIEL